MAERRLPFVVLDDRGTPHQGELLIVRAWPTDVDFASNKAFTIILAQQPLAADSPPPPAPNVCVCAPTSPVRLPSAVAEARVAYEAEDPTSPPPLRLSRRALASYAGGTLLAAQPLTITPQEIFRTDARHPSLDELARELLAGAGRALAYWAALNEGLSLPEPAAQAATPEKLRAALGDLLSRASPPVQGAFGAEAFARLNEVAAGTTPESIATSPAALADDITLVRCLTEQPQATAELAAMRAYLSGAVLEPKMRTLFVDHAATREQLSFVTLLSGPHTLASMRAAFEVFRAAYAAAYAEHHQRYWGAFARLRVTLEEAASTAQALARLNTLQALGRPVGRNAITAYERLLRRPRLCATDDLEPALREQPTCPDCSITMGDVTPSEETERTLRLLQAALAGQQARLASEAVHRVLARGGERLDQFLQIVQASDVTGLAQVLDDELLAFLSELLSEPAAATQAAFDIFEQLARAHPVVSEEQVEAVVETLRQLLSERLAAQREAYPATPAAVRLASATPSPP